MLNLINLFKKEKYVCNHKFPDVTYLADLVDREEKGIMLYFCHKCKDYRYRELSNPKNDISFFDIIQKNKYQIYCDFKIFSLKD